MALSPQARDLVIRVILAEAGGEGPEGQRAVANVIKNRALSGKWGDADQGGLTRLLTAPKQFAAPANVAPSDPNYQRVAAIVDAMANGPVEDNTGGATHFYAPAGMPGGIAPYWASQGTNVRKIGNQIFMTAPLVAATTAGTVDTHAPPSTVSTSGAAPQPAGGADTANADRQFLTSLSAHTDRAGDTANLNPQLVTRLAAAIKQARALGLNVSLESAFREPGQLTAKGDQSQAAGYDAGGNSSHSYGLAVDIAGLDGPNGPITQRWEKIAKENGLSNPYGIGNAKEFNHWQLPPAPLEKTPELLASLKAAKATGNFADVWNAYSGASPESQVATRQTYPPVASAGVTPNVASAQAQPVKAVAPPGASPLPPGGQSPPAASLGAPDPNARFQVLHTMGQGGLPGLPYTALNLTPGAGSTPAAPAPAAPAATTARPDLTQRVPLDQTPPPPPRPTPSAIGAYPLSTTFSTGLGGAAASAPPAPAPQPQSSDFSLPNNSAGGKNPSMVDPRFGNSLAMSGGMPPNVFASAQNLLKLLFPTG